MNKLNIFFDQIKRISFLGRIFKWSSLRSLSYEALQELTSLNNLHTKINPEMENHYPLFRKNLEAPGNMN